VTAEPESPGASGPFRTLVNLQAEGVLVIAQNGQIRFANPAAERLLQFPPGQLAGHTFPFAFAAELAYTAPDGRTLALAMQLEAIDWQGEPAQLASSLRDLSEQKRAEAIAGRHGEILERIAAGAPLEAILDATVRLFEDFHPGSVCSVLLLDDDGLHLRHGAAPGLPPAWVRSVDGQEIGPGAGSCGAAAFYRETVVVTNIETDPLWLRFRELALAHNLRACWSIPVLSGNRKVLGTFAAYYHQPGAPQEGEIETLASCAHLVSVAIERDRTERGLSTGRRLLANAQKLARLGSWEYNPATGRMLWSDEMYAILGIAPGAFDGTLDAFLALVHAHDRAPQEDALRAVLRGQSLLDREYRTVRPNGEVRYIHSRAELVYPTPLTPGSPMSPVVSGTLSDITEQRRTEAALRETEGEFRVLVEALPELIWISTPDEGCIYCNRQWVDYTGVSVHETRGEGWLACFHPEDRESARNGWREAIEKGDALSGESRIRGKDGNYRWWLIRGLPRRDADGKIVKWFGACADIDDLKRAEAANLANTTLIRAANHVARLGGWTIALPDRRVGWSDELCAILDLPAGTRPDLDTALGYYAPEWRETVQKALEETLGGNPPLDFEAEMITATQRRIWARVMGHAERNAAGQMTGLHGALQDITEQKRLRLEVNRLERDLTMILERIEEAFLTIDRDWRFTYLNREAARSLRRDSSSLLGKNIWEEFPGAAGTPFENEVRRAVAERRMVSLEEYYAPLDAWLEVRAYPVDEGLAVYFRDVSDRHRAQEQLRLLETGISRVNDIILITEAEPQSPPGPRILYVNDAFVRKTGYTREEVLGKSPRILQGPNTSRAELDRVRAALDKWQPVRSELINYTKDGDEFWLEMDISPVADSTGWFTHWVAVERDITESHRQREALIDSEKRFRAVFDQAAVGICIVRAWGEAGDGKFLRVNRRFCEIFGYTEEELLSGCTWEELTHPEDRAPERSELGRLLDGDVKSAAWEKRCIQKDGSVVQISVTVSVKSAPGAGLIAVVEDITARKRAEDEVRCAAHTQAEIVRLHHELASLHLDLQASARLVAERAMALTGAAGAVVDLVEGSELVCLAALGAGARATSVPRYPEGSLTGHAVRSGRVMVSEDCATDPRVDAVLRSEWGIRSGIVAPMRSGDQVTGVFIILYTRPHAFSDRDVNTLQILAGSLSAIVQRCQAEAQLRAAADQYRLLFDSNPQPMWTVDVETLRFLAVNKTTVLRYGYSEAEFLAMTLPDIHPEEEIPALRRRLAQPRSAEGTVLHASRHRTKSGSVIDVEISCDRILFNGKPAGLALAQDVTERLRAQRDLVRLNRAHQMLTGCDEALIRGSEEESLLQDICRIAVGIGGYRMAWVGYARQDAAKSILPVAHAGLETGYLSEISLTWSDEEISGLGPAGLTLRTGVATASPDIGQDPSFAWRESALKREFRSLLCLPLKDAQSTFGVLCLYSSEIQKTQAEETGLLQRLADNVAFGIGSIRSQKEKLRIEAAVSKVAAGVSGSTGTEFFEKLARNMAEAVGASAGLVSRLIPGEPKTLSTIAVVIDGELVENFSYHTGDPPCEALIDNQEYIAQEQGKALFPAPSRLASVGARVCAGRRLDSSAGTPLGSVVVLFREPPPRVDFITSTLRIFAARAAGEMERQESDQLIREQASLLDKAKDAIVVRGMDHRVLHWNRGAENLFGWTSKEALGRTTAELHWVDSEAFQRATAQLLETGTWRGQTEARRKDGSFAVVEDNWTLVRDEKGAPKSVLAITTDLTERLAMEDQLRQSQRLEAVGQLTGGVAHDFNNLLTVILGNSELLLEELPADSHLRILAEMTRTAARRGADLTRRLLAFARRQSLHPSPVDVTRLLAGMEGLLRRTLNENIRLKLVRTPNLWPALADPSQLEGAVLNLCLNSRDAMPKGGLLTIETAPATLDRAYCDRHAGAKPGRYVMVAVSDTGSGISPASLARVFEPFFTTKGEGKGTGLGLSMVYGFVTQSQGHITIHSEPDKGTTVRMFLPVSGAPAPAEEAQPASLLVEGGSETVLVVEDNDLVRQYSASQFECLGYRVITARSAAEALDIIRGDASVDLLFTDIVMPGMNGLQLAEVAALLRPDLKVLYTSGYSDNVLTESARNRKGFKILDKPYLPSDLARKVRAVLLNTEEENSRKI
jgi:PAS domain S-box-containing protein